MNLALIVSFLKAMPELVKVINRLGDAFEKYQEARIDKKINEMREKTDANIKRLLQAKSNEEIQAIVKDINSVFSSKL